MSKETEEYVKIGFLAGGVGLMGYAAFYFVGEMARARRSSQRPRQPWDLG